MAAEPEPKMLTARDLVEHLIPAKSMVDGWYVATKGCPHCHSKPFRYKDRRNGMRGDVRFVCPGGCTPALLAPDLGVSVRALVGHQLVAIDGEILPAEMTSNPVNGHQPAEPSATETAVAPASAAPPVATPSTPSPAAPSVARHPVIEALLDEMVGAQDPWLFVNTIDLDENHIEMGYRRVYFDNFVAMLVPLRPHEQDPLVKRGSQVFGVRPDTIRASIQALRRAETVVTQAPATERQLQNLQLACESVLTADDPLTMVAEELVRLGCGGDSKIPLLIYLAGTTRLLLKVRGAPPCHLQLNGPAGTGKSYICDAVLSLFPAASLLRYDATSPRVMLYDEVPIKHKILFYTEADAIPGVSKRDDDNPTGAYFRTLLQSGTASYRFLVRDKETQKQVAQEMTKEGPAQVLTTTINRLSEQQLDSRFLAAEAVTTQAQRIAAIDAQVRLEDEGTVPEPDPQLVAFQTYLQALAPIMVHVPFARALGRCMAETSVDPRLLRDFQRVKALIKAVAILHHHRRERDAKGRLVAQLRDYTAVAELMGEVYEGTATGVSRGVRRVVEAVEKAPRRTVSGIAAALKISHQAVSKHVRTAVARGWLENHELRHGYGMQLAVGDPLPLPCGLPSVQQIQNWQPPRRNPVR